MENASKALLMAASVLMGIIILSLGTYLFVTFSSHTKTVSDEYELNKIQEFNDQFTKYEDKKNNTIYDVVSIINAAKENNIDSSNYVKVYLGDSSFEKKDSSRLEKLILDDNESIRENNPLPTYEVKCTINKDNGYVNEIKIKKVI